MESIVLELGDHVASAYACRLLAGRGYRVVKIAHPENLSRMPPFVRTACARKSAYELWLEEGKQRHEMSPSQAYGDGLLFDILARAKVIVAAPGALPEAVLLQWAESRVVLSFTSHGLRQQASQAQSTHATVYLESGLGVFSRDVDGAPLVPVVPIAFMQAGMIGALLAQSLAYGNKTGLADLSVVEANLGFLNGHLANTTYEAKDSRRELFPNPRGPIAILPASDGLFQLNCPEQRQWEGLVEIMGRPSWADSELFADPFLRGRNWSALEPLITLWSTQHTRQEIFLACQGKRIPCAPIYTVRDVLEQRFNTKGRFRPFPVAGQKQARIPKTLAGEPADAADIRIWNRKLERVLRAQGALR